MKKSIPYGSEHCLRRNLSPQNHTPNTSYKKVYTWIHSDRYYISTANQYRLLFGCIPPPFFSLLIKPIKPIGRHLYGQRPDSCVVASRVTLEAGMKTMHDQTCLKDPTSIFYLFGRWLYMATDIFCKARNLTQ